ncbi:D-alanyl-D-alanine carboxypeptidase/D-alanyl-D-alanine-endopeptidase [Nocardiopsis sp. MG754419]|uniref:D-alanyl-D-alanine carboxypeptidase/D-alanyl-D-alanine endopeptidase n=1 Tax=Nocardiopsis sp. MG754419 TaxID=2259865 RepID=UPI001BA455E0|nr:D-alanyl-D-alanine carboxypeptidase/D-alanyl-D-alanine-endopeptidase [Nocardiopsis sp. MG754419]MBR8743136.1 D-alanyl-D-alanine carboxypeptidase/D-alanyl-D-alanine-endopeptidase [Nocardiopsis sp. MG754419]
MISASPHPPSRLRRQGGWLAAALVTVPLALAPSPAIADTADQAERVDDLRADIDTILDDPALEGATSGVVVTDADTGEALYSQDADTALLPASNMKSFSTAAALQALGTDHTFTTEAVVERRPGRGDVPEVYLVGGGDPTLNADDLDAMAADVAASGVTSVGEVFADDSWFDDQRLVDDWWPEDEAFAYSAQISALTVAHGDRYDTGVTEVTVTAADEGDAVSVDPGAAEGYVELDNQAVTGSAEAENTLAIDRPVGTNTIEVTGTLPVDADPVVAVRTVDEPAALAGHLFARALEENGVEVEGDVDRGAVPADWQRPRVVAENTSMPLEEVLVPLMKFSNNGHTEMLVKTLGRHGADEGSWEAGLTEVDTALQELGVDTSDLVLTDGSGLSRGNLMTADTMIDLLDRAQDAPWYEVWHDSLPVAGDGDPFVGGTLASRMADTAAADVAQAKTGTMTGVSALSGYVQGPDGAELYFSVVNNDHAGAAPLHVQDAIVVRLAEYLGNQVPEGTTALRSAPTVGGELECSWELTC